MLAIALVIAAAAPQESLAARVRHLETAGSAEAPAPSPDGQRVAFVTTLFGSRQAASMAADGSYPVQLTDEQGGVLSLRYGPVDPRMLIAVVVRQGHRRLVLLDEQGEPPVELDPAPGEQVPGGFSRDGKRFFYAVVDGDKAALKQLALDTRKATDIAPPPPAAGPAAAGTNALSLADSLHGLSALGPISPDGRSILAQVLRGDGEALILVDLATARGEIFADAKGRYRTPHFMPDGKSVYVLTDAGRKTMGVDSIAVQGHARKPVYAPAVDLEGFAISEDGHRLAVAADQQGETIFSVLDLPSLRPQPLPQPPAGALAPAARGESPLTWTKAGDRLLFGWRLSDDTTDVWAFRMGFGTPLRLTRSPRPGLPRNSIARPEPVRAKADDGSELAGYLWRPAPGDKPPRVVVLAAATPVRPVFDKRIAALNAAGLAVLTLNAPGTQAAALRYLKDAEGLDGAAPFLLVDGDVKVDAPASWSGVIPPPSRVTAPGLEVDPDRPDLEALLKFVKR